VLFVPAGRYVLVGDSFTHVCQSDRHTAELNLRLGR
jgi:hypothetical protein